MKLRTHTEKKRGNWGEFNVLFLFVCKDFGLETLGDLVEKTTFPWLMSNVIDNETGRPLADGKVSWNVKTVSGRNDKDGHAGRSLAEGMCLWIDYVASWNRRGGMLTFDCLTCAKFLTPWMLPLIGLPFDGVGWPQDCTLWPLCVLCPRSSHLMEWGGHKTVLYDLFIICTLGLPRDGVGRPQDRSYWSGGEGVAGYPGYHQSWRGQAFERQLKKVLEGFWRL